MTSASLGAVFSLNQVMLEDGTAVSTALETDPPGRPSASIAGSYTLPAPTVAGEVFRASVGFCSGTGTGAQIQYSVIDDGSPQTPVTSGTLIAGPGQPAKSIDAPVPTGTTKIKLLVSTGNPSPAQAYVVWVDPRIE